MATLPNGGKQDSTVPSFLLFRALMYAALSLLAREALDIREGKPFNTDVQSLQGMCAAFGGLKRSEVALISADTDLTVENRAIVVSMIERVELGVITEIIRVMSVKDDDFSDESIEDYAEDFVVISQIKEWKGKNKSKSTSKGVGKDAGKDATAGLKREKDMT